MVVNLLGRIVMGGMESNVLSPVGPLVPIDDLLKTDRCSA